MPRQRRVCVTGLTPFAEFLQAAFAYGVIKNGAANGTRTRDPKIHKIVRSLQSKALCNPLSSPFARSLGTACGTMWHVSSNQEEVRIPAKSTNAVAFVYLPIDCADRPALEIKEQLTARSAGVGNLNCPGPSISSLPTAG